jgi:hypothetical protein
MAYNEHLDAVKAALLGRTTEMLDVFVRSGFSELIEALREETAVRVAQVQRLSSLVDAPDHSRDIVLSSFLLIMAVACGTAGNLVGAAHG